LTSRDEEDTARPEKAQPSPSAGKMSNPFLQLAQDPTVPTYKQGILARKMHHDADGKKSECREQGGMGEWLCSGDCAVQCMVYRGMARVKDRQPLFFSQHVLNNDWRVGVG
jgi:hypothetical protein